MLCLSRKKDESIIITPPGCETAIRVTVCRIGKDKVRIGIDAGKLTAVDREEIHNAKQEQST